MNEKSTIERMIAAVEARDAHALGALYAEDAVGHHPLAPEPARGRQAITEAEQGLFDAFSDVRVELRTLARAESVEIGEVILRATNTGPLDLGDGPVEPTGRRIEVQSVWVLEVGSDGLIREGRDYFDTARLFEQLGLAPAAAGAA